MWVRQPGSQEQFQGAETLPSLTSHPEEALIQIPTLGFESSLIPFNERLGMEAKGTNICRAPTQRHLLHVDVH